MSLFEADTNRLQALFQAGRYAELEASAQTFLARQPRAGGIWYLLGQTYLAQGRLQAARQALERASMLLSDQAPVWSVLAACQNALGERQEAARCFERSLALDSSYAEIWAHAGRNALELGRHKEAERYCRRALALQPGMAEAQYNLAHAFKAQGRIDESLGAFRRVRELAPAVAEAHNAVALGLLELGQAEEALAACRCALELKPGLIDAMVNLGSALSALRCYEEAAMAYQDALEQNPDLAEAHSNLGNVLWELGRPEAALAVYRRALQLKPDFAEASLNLGNALSDLGELDEALAAYRRVMELQPGLVEAHYGAGNVLRRLKRFDEAIAVFRKTVEWFPFVARAHTQLGIALQSAGRNEESVAAYRHAIQLQPEFVEPYHKLADCLGRMGRTGEAVGVYRDGLRVVADDPGMWSGLLFMLNYRQTGGAGTELAEARAYGEKMASQVVPFVHHHNTPIPDRRLRIGLVSGDFGEHPVGYFLEGVVENLDAASVELFAYETFKRKGELNQRLRRAIPHWYVASPVGVTDEMLANQIRTDGIDILIDLAGHTAHNRLPVFAWKPAPVQVTWLGYLGTTGLEAMDYLLADPYVLPLREEDRFTETPWHLPESYICFSPPEAMVEVGRLPALSNGFVTFGSFNNLSKVGDPVMACWAQLLQAVPDSRLFLKSKALAGDDVRKAVIERFARFGVGAERLQMEGLRASRQEHFCAYQQVDIALDTFPYPGITTTVEGLWMGVPTLALKGDRFLGHQGETILTNAGLPEWIAEDGDDYVAKAAAYARDLEHLADLRARLRNQVLASPLFDAPRFARHFEQALRGMWQVWCNEEK
ncbi:tetratricopeptide repeat protein [Thiobacillus sp.]|jgi:predicted O-linked N-acetylglucosamine transferase (SPINDLY family)|uniref:tetratricopeptide repeat protein n=1 Tax=Thiobacillus sp. TaxID=924 RepID=UPI0025E88331|nr:tetratricopeptide repeat protein [Thiobacillus sp.]